MPTTLATYRCPNCQASLQTRPDGPWAWLRCPRCGRAGRSPEAAVEPEPEPGLEPVVLVPVGSLPPRREVVGADPARDWRIVHGSGLFVSTTLLLFSFLDGSIVGSSVFGVLALACLTLLVLPGRRRS